MADMVASEARKDVFMNKNAGFSIKNVRQETLVLATTLLIVVLCSFTVNGFMTLANIFALARSVSVLGILGVGMTVVVIGRGLDLSQVAVMAQGPEIGDLTLERDEPFGGAVGRAVIDKDDLVPRLRLQRGRDLAGQRRDIACFVLDRHHH